MREHSLRVLWVSAESSFWGPLAAYVQSMDCAVLETTPATAERLARLDPRHEHFDVALVDDGDAAARCAQAAPPMALVARIKALYPALPWIMLTSGDESVGAAALAQGAYGVLRQPFGVDELVALCMHAAADPTGQQPVDRAGAAPRDALMPARLHAGAALHAALRTLTAARDLDALLQAACRTVVEVFAVDHCGLVLFQPDYGPGRVVAEYPPLGTGGLLIPRAGVAAEEYLLNAQGLLCIERVAGLPDLGPVGAILGRFDIRSILIVPIVDQGRVIGSFSLDSIGRERGFTSDEIALGVLVARELAAAIERAALARRVHQAERLSLLAAMSDEIATQRELDTILEAIAQHMARLVGARRSLLLFVDLPNRRVLKTTGAGFPPEHLASIDFAEVEAGISRWVIEQREGVLVEHAQTDPRNTGVALRKAQAFDTGPLMIVPLIGDDQVLGTLSAINKAGDRCFTQDDLDVARKLAEQATIAITNARAFQEVEHQRTRLAALDVAARQLRPEGDLARLRQDIVRLAMDLVRASSGGLCLHRAGLGVLEVQAIDGLPAALLGTLLPRSAGLIGQVARQGVALHDPAYGHSSGRDAVLLEAGITALIGVPLKQAGSVEAVLFVGRRADEPPFTAIDVEVLERFALRAALVAHTASLLSSEQRIFSSLTLLHRISDYIQSIDQLDKMLWTVLTGVTAGYGLGFNRAVVLLLEGPPQTLVSRLAVGQLDADAAREDWGRHRELGREDFARFLQLLEANQLPPTPLHTRMAGLRLSQAAFAGTAFEAVIAQRRYQLVPTAELEALPAPFHDSFAPISPLVLVPLIARAEVIGVLVADNKFSATPITQDSIELLITFANTAAIAIDNRQLFEQTVAAKERFQSFHAASSALVSSLPPDQVLGNIVEQARIAASASGVSMILLDTSGVIKHVIATGTDDQAAIEADLIRPDGFSMQVLRTGQAVTIPNAWLQRDEVNPIMIERQIAAAMCLPVLLEGTPIGVIWMHYDQPRSFSTAEEQAVQLFANQAAIAYDNARRIQELEQMRQAAQVLAATVGLDAVLQQIVDSVTQVFAPDSAVLLAFDRQRNRFIPSMSTATGVSAGILEQFRKIEPRYGGTAYTIYEHGWVGVHDIDDHESYPFLGQSTRQLLEATRARAFQGVSLHVGDEVLGVLYINYQRRRHFSQEDVQRATTFANHAALALKTATLLEQLNKAHTAARAVAETTVLEEDLDQKLDAIARRTIEVLQCDAVTIYVYDQTNDRLHHPPVMQGVWHPQRARERQDVARDSIVYRMLHRAEPYIADYAREDAEFKQTRFTHDEGVVSCVGVPLRVETEPVGVLFVNYRTAHRFTTEELQHIQLFANQTAVAIRNTHLYRERQRRVNALLAIHQAGQAVTGALTLQQALDEIIKQGLRLVGEGEATGCMSHLALVDEDGQTLHFTAAYPPETLPPFAIDLVHGPRIGITGRAVLTGTSQNIRDVSRDPDHIPYNQRGGSELAVPIKDGERVIGTLNMKHPQRNAFSDEDRQVLESLAGYAAVAIQNAGLYTEVRRRLTELEQTRKMLDARTAVAMMGMLSSTWRHTVRIDAVTIRDLLTLVRRDLGRDGLTEQLAQRFDQIDALASRIQDTPITDPPTSGESAALVPLNDFLHERIGQRAQRLAEHRIAYRLDFRLSATAAVHCNLQWLRQAFDLLIDNAVEAMQQSPRRELAIATQAVDGGAEILIRDTGRGIPDHIRPKVFLEQITDSSKGMGMGLLLTQTIVHAFRGEVGLVDTGLEGTTMRIWLPLAPS